MRGENENTIVLCCLQLTVSFNERQIKKSFTRLTTHTLNTGKRYIRSTNIHFDDPPEIQYYRTHLASVCAEGLLYDRCDHWIVLYVFIC